MQEGKTQDGTTHFLPIKNFKIGSDQLWPAYARSLHHASGRVSFVCLLAVGDWLRLSPDCSIHTIVQTAAVCPISR